jgi:hypothetical protein
MASTTCRAALEFIRVVLMPVQAAIKDELLHPWETLTIEDLVEDEE